MSQTAVKADLDAIREEAEQKMNFEYVERESRDCLRFDYGHLSCWVFESGTISWAGATDRKLAAIIKKHTKVA